MHPYYIIRFVGGVLYLVGMLMMAYNIWRTVVSRQETVGEAAAAVN